MDGMLSQEEINALLDGIDNFEETDVKSDLSNYAIDLLKKSLNSLLLESALMREEVDKRYDKKIDSLRNAIKKLE